MNLAYEKAGHSRIKGFIMMQSLWSGISGLAAHQVGLDVEGNNIANVNTVGFKYSRTSFQDLLSKNVQGATGPQASLGGKNAIQVGSGTTVASVERIHTQGANQNTDRTTDLSIKGEGYFIVSADGGDTQMYTRAGNFSFDATGNLTAPNGAIVQGWTADNNFDIDTTKSTSNITIDPNMTVPAKATTQVEIDANLNAGRKLSDEGRSPAEATVLATQNFNDLFGRTGSDIKLTEGTDTLTLNLTRTFSATNVLDTATGAIIPGPINVDSTAQYTFTYGPSVNDSDNMFQTMGELVDEINRTIADSTGVNRNQVLLKGDGRIAFAGHLSSVVDSLTTNSVFKEAFAPANTGVFETQPFKANPNAYLGATDVGEMFNANGETISLKSGEGIKVKVDNLGETRNFVYREPDPNNNLDYLSNDFQNIEDIELADKDQGFHWLYDSSNKQAMMNVGQKISIDFDAAKTGLTTKTYTYGSDFTSIEDLLNQIKVDLTNAENGDLALTFDSTTGTIKDTSDIINAISVQDSTGAAPAAGSVLDNVGGILSPIATNQESNIVKKNDTYYFTDVQELMNLYQQAIDESGDPLISTIPTNTTVSLDPQGRIRVQNNGDTKVNITTSGYPDNLTANKEFRDIMASLTKEIPENGYSISQPMYAATHSTSIEVFDSAGSKHTLTFNFTKTSTSGSNTEPTVWKWYVEAPEPATFEFPAFGEIKFNPNGSIQSFSPPSVTINPNTGSESGQVVQLDFGSLNGFDGITSFAKDSITYSSTRDGYSGGELRDLEIDTTGTIIGIFSNDQNFELGQVAISTFANDEGLVSVGSNMFSKSPNSGQEIIGTAAKGGRGTVASKTLEMSNVDLSKSLTNLIVIQRGFQANSTTVTTSDQMLQTLLQLKQ